MSSPTNTSPDPASALKVAIMFVKQYYKCLSSQPDMLERFYAPPEHHASYLSHGEGSEPTAPFSLGASNHGHDRWGCAENEKMLFEFEDGAIDAQPSQNDGILMVVTASVIFHASADGVKTQRRKTFVQTFFLAKSGRNFAVTNDILRFLTIPVVEPTADTSVETPVVQETLDAAPEPQQVEIKTETVESTPVIADEKKTEEKTPTEDESSAPGGGVEETKEEAPEEEEPVAEPKKRSNSKENNNKKKNKGKQQQQQQQQAPPASKPAPGSWASLVVSGGSAPNTPSRAQEKKPPTQKPSSKQPPLPPSEEKDTAETAEKKKDKAASTTKANAKSEKSNNPKKDKTKRDPDNTLVIKNLSENIKEQDIINMFQPFATQTKAKIVGTNLNHHRLLAFVDYDSVAPVMAALKKHKETPLEWNGKVLEVDQKTMEQRARRKATATTQNNQTNGYRNNAGAGRGGNKQFNNNNNNNNNNNQNNNNQNNNNNGRGDGGRRRGTRAGR